MAEVRDFPGDIVRRNITWVLVSVVAILGCVVSVCAVLLLLLFSAIMNRPTDGFDDLSLVVSADDLAPYLELPGQRSLCEETRRSVYSDGETLYKYTYEADRDPNATRIFTVASHTNVYPVKQMAVNVFETRVNDAHLLISLTKSSTLRRCDDLLDLGDERFVALLLNEFGDADGMVVVVRSKSTVVSFRMIGHAIQDSDTLTAIVAPKLRT